jgi:hypothetical protein
MNRCPLTEPRGCRFAEAERGRNERGRDPADFVCLLPNQTLAHRTVAGSHPAEPIRAHHSRVKKRKAVPATDDRVLCEYSAERRSRRSNFPPQSAGAP